MLAIYKYDYEYGRMGDVAGLFLAHKEEVEDNNGREIYFGEILGKHSEVVIEWDLSDFTLVTEDPDAIKMFKQLDLATGYNPFDYID